MARPGSNTSEMFAGAHSMQFMQVAARRARQRRSWDDRRVASRCRLMTGERPGGSATDSPGRETCLWGSSRMKRLAIRVRGTVQGVGFRPHVYREAVVRGLVGCVSNDAGGVTIDVQGDDCAVDSFVTALRAEAPAASRVVGLEIDPSDLHAARGFRIVESRIDGERVGPSLPADLAPCSECLREIHDPGNRRSAYPFTNCTQCGPRYTIVDELPYDRARTTMSHFLMCDACAREYADPGDRRYHAEPTACPRCGPSLRLRTAAGRLLATAEQALALAAEAIDSGAIVAIKGVGGYQLVCDATGEAAVLRLRERKRRPDKPFAVMFG